MWIPVYNADSINGHPGTTEAMKVPGGVLVMSTATNGLQSVTNAMAFVPGADMEVFAIDGSEYCELCSA